MNPDKLSIRPVINGVESSKSLSFEESFQNNTIRPIIKLQHDILIAYFNDYLLTRNRDFTALSNDKKQDYIYKAFNKDNSFKLELKGIIIGHFTIDEFTQYCCNKSDFNKRILTMIKERIISVLI